MSPATAPPPLITLITIPREVQVHILSFLRAYDLSAVQLTCRYYNDPELIHRIITYFTEHVYTPELAAKSCQNKPNNETKYTLEDLRNIELTVVARILSLPEPKTGYYVSKAWVRKTLLWLEKVNEPPAQKKLTKKQQRQRARRLSDVSPPWPNVNSDILCCHQRLQRCNAKTARARRRLMDKQAWKILRKLYPDSTQLESVSGECIQCFLETETSRKNEQDRLEQEKIERKKPLSNSHVRRFYTRTRGVPVDCMLATNPDESHSCPLVAGTYFIIPRSWCYHWRRFIKTGEGEMPFPPESSALLCDAHKYALIPPHLESYLRGETANLLSTARQSEPLPCPTSPRTSFQSLPVGMIPNVDPASVSALMAAGIPHAEIATQQIAMLQLEQQQRSPVPSNPRSELATTPYSNELLDRENHVVVELVTKEEWLGLQETGCWPKQHSHFAMTVTVQACGQYQFSTVPCRECDPTGSRFTACAEVKYRRKRWEPKSVEQRRVPRVEY